MSIRLRELVRSVRQCKTAAEEREVVAKESAALRNAFKDQDTAYRHRNVSKLMYIHMLGYPTHFGQMETLKLIAANGFPEKRIGYLGLMILLDERQEVLMLVTNSLKNDLSQRNQYIVGLALCALGNICSTEMARDLAPEVERLLASSNSYIRKKAALCATRVLRKVPEVAESFLDKSAALLNDRHHGVLLGGATLMLELCDIEPTAVETYRRHVPLLCKILRSLLMSGFAPEHDVGGITDPFLQVKILRLLRVLGRGNAEASDAMSDVLAQVATNTEGARNAGNAILYECVQTIMGVDSIAGLRVLAVNILGRFLANRDNNIRYVALNTLAKVVAVDTQAVQRHRNTVVDCVKDADVSIRRRALELVYALVNESNIKTLTKELLDYLRVSDLEFKPDLTNKICMLVQRYAPDKQWHFDSLVQVLVQAGAYVKEEVCRALVVLVTNAPALHGYAARACFRALRAAGEQAVASLLLVCTWLIGEYGDLLLAGAGGALAAGEEGLAVPPGEVTALLEAVLRSAAAAPEAREYALTALMKLSARLPSEAERIKGIIERHTGSPALELQARACEFSRIFGFERVRPQLLEHMPPLDEATYSRNLSSSAGVADSAPAAQISANGNTGSGSAAKPADAIADLLSLDDEVPVTAGGAAATASAVDMLHDLLGGGTGAAAPAAAAPAQPSPAALLDDLLAPTAPAPTGLPAAASPAGGMGGMDAFGELLGGAPAAAPQQSIPPVTVFDKDGIRIIFQFSKPAGQPALVDVLATFINSGAQPVTDFSLQAAVPKFMQLRLDPATSAVLPPGGGGGPPVTQALHVSNSQAGVKPLVMRLRIAYTLAGQPRLEQCEVKDLPPGL